jgi:hypothetical protein
MRKPVVKHVIATGLGYQSQPLNTGKGYKKYSIGFCYLSLYRISQFTNSSYQRRVPQSFLISPQARPPDTHLGSNYIQNKHRNGVLGQKNTLF